MAVDETMRKLRIPPKFLPYLEKHRIYETFHDLANELAIYQPEDPLQFTKAFLVSSEKNKDKHLVMLMAPPYLDRIQLAQLLSEKTGCEVLSRYLNSLPNGDFLDAKSLAKTTALTIKESDKGGWILADFPDTENEAKTLVNEGVIPTHAFLLLQEPQESTALSCYGTQEEKSVPNMNINVLQTTPSILLENEKSLHRLQNLFKSALKIIKIGDKTLDEIANACSRLLTKSSVTKPRFFRVALIGPRGSKRRSIAAVLQKKYSLVHVDMDQLIQRAMVSETDLGDLLRKYEKEVIVYPIKIVLELLKNRLHQTDCLERGYVLTNFPTSVEDFAVLDSIDTPPNIVIFLDIDDNIILDRLSDRGVNKVTGKLYSKKAIGNKSLMKSQIMTHPDDEQCKVEEEVKFYRERSQKMLDYCGSTGAVINARGPLKQVLERVESVLMNPPIYRKPRTGVVPSYPIKESTYSNTESRKYSSYPTSYTEVVPLIDSEEVMRRFLELKKGVSSQTANVNVDNEESENATSHEGEQWGSVSHVDNEVVSIAVTQDYHENDHNDEIISILSPKTSAARVISSTLSVQ